MTRQESGSASCERTWRPVPLSRWRWRRWFRAHTRLAVLGVFWGGYPRERGAGSLGMFRCPVEEPACGFSRGRDFRQRLGYASHEIEKTAKELTQLWLQFRCAQEINE
uniref:Uncharacterized protein n=1 Tax=Oryza sativa subsp. japonica TaxID=39947 RepID=Q7X6K4_ORYSJ|nr:hypothetical protein [Oryza sativa Japonica Group]BAC80134.1 hypothetical protein [Oryza sativa Japonica Group]